MRCWPTSARFDWQNESPRANRHRAIRAGLNNPLRCIARVPRPSGPGRGNCWRAWLFASVEARCPAARHAAAHSAFGQRQLMAQMATIFNERENRRPGVTVVPSQKGMCILFGMTCRQGRCSMIFRRLETRNRLDGRRKEQIFRSPGHYFSRPALRLSIAETTRKPMDRKGSGAIQLAVPMLLAI